MSLPIMLDVAIGLVFTYVLLAIVVSGLQEAIAGWLALRGKHLRTTLVALLSGKGAPGVETKLFADVFGHGLVADLSRTKLPAYVPSRNFALAVMESLKDGSQSPLASQVERSIQLLPSGPARDSLTALVTQAGGDLDALRGRLETWFDDAMDRASGQYKRRTQFILFFLGLAVAVVLNVDTLSLVRTLATNEEARKEMVAQAQKYTDAKVAADKAQVEADEKAKAAEAAAPATPAASATPDAAAEKAAKDARDAAVRAADEAQTLLRTLPLQIGWQPVGAKTDTDASAWQAFKSRFTPPLLKDGTTAPWRGEGLWLLVGWVITGLAASLGAPYWFALLQQLLNLRNAGPKPASQSGATKK